MDSAQPTVAPPSTPSGATASAAAAATVALTFDEVALRFFAGGEAESQGCGNGSHEDPRVDTVPDAEPCPETPRSRFAVPGRTVLQTLGIIAATTVLVCGGVGATLFGVVP